MKHECIENSSIMFENLRSERKVWVQKDSSSKECFVFTNTIYKIGFLLTSGCFSNREVFLHKIWTGFFFCQ